MASNENPGCPVAAAPALRGMPVLKSGVAGNAGRTRKGRLWLLLILLVSAAPIVASYLTYYVFRPHGAKAYGELISPQRDLPALQAIDPEGRGVDLRSLRGQWLLMTVGDASCDAECERHLYLLRQLHVGMGAEQQRMERVWLATGSAPIAERLRQQLEGTTILRVDAAALGAWLYPEPGHALEDHLYLVDPLGHWMMRFPPQTDLSAATRIKRDLARLMRAASSWDRAGR